MFRNSQNNDGMNNNITGVNTMGYGGSGCGLPRLQALEIVKTVLLSSIYSVKLLELKPDTLKAIFVKAAEV